MPDMEIKNENYPVYAAYKIGEIPSDIFREVVIEFAGNAMFVMNSRISPDERKPAIDNIVAMIRDKFKEYPLHVVAAAFDQGSLGVLGGTTAFTIRNVFIWLNNLKEKNQRLAHEEWSKKEDARKRKEKNDWMLNSYGYNIYGTALSIKTRWSCDKLINPDNWDKYSLDKIVSLLKMGESVNTIRPDQIYVEDGKA